MSPSLSRRLALLLLLSLPAAAAEPMYKWVDASGRVHYSQTPPPKGRYETVTPTPQRPISATPAPAPEPGAPTKMQQYLDDVGKTNEARERERLAQAKAAEARAARCRQARSREAFVDRGRVGSRGEDGEVEMWSAEKIDAEREASRREIEANC